MKYILIDNRLCGEDGTIIELGRFRNFENFVVDLELF